MKLIYKLEDIKMISENNRQVPIRTGKTLRLISTKEYRNYKKLLTDFFLLSNISEETPIFKDFSAKLTIHTYKDLTNLIKPIFDALEESNLINNDRYLLNCQLIKIPIKKGKLDSFYLELWD